MWRWNSPKHSILEQMYWLPFGNGRLADNPNIIEIRILRWINPEKKDLIY